MRRRNMRPEEIRRLPFNRLPMSCVLQAMRAVTSAPTNERIVDAAIMYGYAGHGMIEMNWLRMARVLGVEVEKIDLHCGSYHRTTVGSLASTTCASGAWLVGTRGHLLAIVDGNVIDWKRGPRREVTRLYRVMNATPSVKVAPIVTTRGERMPADPIVVFTSPVPRPYAFANRLANHLPLTTADHRHMAYVQCVNVNGNKGVCLSELTALCHYDRKTFRSDRRKGLVTIITQ